MKKYSVMKSMNMHPKKGKRTILEMTQILNVRSFSLIVSQFLLVDCFDKLDCVDSALLGQKF